jgi:hypothetical protein
VCGEDRGAAYHGRYGFQTFAVNPSAESRSDTVAIGDTIATESIDVPGDIDEFFFYGKAGQHIDVLVQGLAASAEGSFDLNVGIADSAAMIAGAITPVSAATLAGQHTHRIDLPLSGWYRIIIQPFQNGGNPRERGPYRFAIPKVPGNPETVSANVTPGDSITNEQLDNLDDVDEYVVNGSPNQEFAVLLSGLATGGLTAVIYDTANGANIGSVVAATPRLSSGRLFLPPSGVIGLRVYSPHPCPPGIFCINASAPGYYFLQIVAINRAPETGSSVVSLGDTITEAIDPISDVDEFTFSGNAGQVVNLHFSLPANVGSPGLMVEFIDSPTNTVLGSAWTFNPSPVGDVSTGAISLPRTGSYLIRVRGVTDKETKGAYRFVVQ